MWCLVVLSYDFFLIVGLLVFEQTGIPPKSSHTESIRDFFQTLAEQTDEGGFKSPLSIWKLCQCVSYLCLFYHQVSNNVYIFAEKSMFQCCRQFQKRQALNLSKVKHRSSYISSLTKRQKTRNQAGYSTIRTKYRDIVNHFNTHIFNTKLTFL